MISELKGKVSTKEKDAFTIMVGGFGLSVMTTPEILSKVRVSDEIHLYTRLIVREDGWHLFGFRSKDERNVFDLLLTVKGIGPKLAMGILGKLKPEEFYQACISQDERVFSSVPGVGKKTAQRITLELRDRIGLSKSDREMAAPSDIFGQASQALEGLGYSLQEAEGVLQRVREEKGTACQSMSVEDLLKEALRKLARI